MKPPRNRNGSIGLQLAALVDLLFVITFLLIWERESLMHKRIQQVKASVKNAQTDVQKAADSQRAALEALAQAEKEKLKALEEARKLADQLDRITADLDREKKVERDLHTQFEWMLDGMRRGRDGTRMLPPPVRFGTNIAAPGLSGGALLPPSEPAGTIPAIPPPDVPAPAGAAPIAPVAPVVAPGAAGPGTVTPAAGGGGIVPASAGPGTVTPAAGGGGIAPAPAGPPASNPRATGLAPAAVPAVVPGRSGR